MTQTLAPGRSSPDHINQVFSVLSQASGFWVHFLSSTSAEDQCLLSFHSMHPFFLTFVMCGKSRGSQQSGTVAPSFLVFLLFYFLPCKGRGKHHQERSDLPHFSSTLVFKVVIVCMSPSGFSETLAEYNSRVSLSFSTLETCFPQFTFGAFCRIFCCQMDIFFVQSNFFPFCQMLK